jgi:predicted nuclease with TOPRIM domain
MSSPVLVPIVEGHSEVESIPVLLRRLLSEKSRYDIKIARPLRVGRYKVVRAGEFERAIELARRRPEGCDAILLLLDADDDCPKDLAPLTNLSVTLRSCCQLYRLRTTYQEST